MYEWNAKAQYAQNDLNLRILRMLDGTFAIKGHVNINVFTKFYQTILYGTRHMAITFLALPLLRSTKSGNLANPLARSMYINICAKKYQIIKSYGHVC